MAPDTMGSLGSPSVPPLPNPMVEGSSVGLVSQGVVQVLSAVRGGRLDRTPTELWGPWLDSGQVSYRLNTPETKKGVKVWIVGNFSAKSKDSEQNFRQVTAPEETY